MPGDLRPPQQSPLLCTAKKVNDKKSRWRSQKDGLSQGSVLANLLVNIFTNDQPLPTECSRFIYDDNVCITTQQSDFQHVEQILELALDEMGIYYWRIHLKPNSAKTQICCFHLRNIYAKRKFNVTWTFWSVTTIQTLPISESHWIGR